MSDTLDEGSSVDRAVDLCTLPARPNLEYERKEAKALLRRLLNGDAEGLKRVASRHSPVGDGAKLFQLADAQLTIAREYGFTSWPKLVSYYEGVERQEQPTRRPTFSETVTVYEKQVERLLAAHRDRQQWVAEALTNFVPRFLGKSPSAAFDAAVTVDEARLCVARLAWCPSWAVLTELAPVAERPRLGVWLKDDSPHRMMLNAMSAADLEQVQRIVAQHPELLTPTPFEKTTGQTVARMAVQVEQGNPGLEARMVTDWLLSRRGDPTLELNGMLLGHVGMSVEETMFLLDRGADPGWIAPNGISVIEHAIIRYGNGKAVDVVAQRVRPPNALWIAAGLGDVTAVERYVEPSGALTPAARLHRPDFMAIQPHSIPNVPDVDDTDLLWEAAYVAEMNQRTAVLDLLFDRGFQIDYARWGTTLATQAVARQDVGMVEYLISRGANLDVTGWRWEHSARSMAQWRYEMTSSRGRGGKHAAVSQRIFELCGGVARTVVASDAARVAASQAMTGQVFAAAENDAVRFDQEVVEPHNLLIGALHVSPLMLMGLLRAAGADEARLRAIIANRLSKPRARSLEVPLSEKARALVKESTTGEVADSPRGDGALRLLWALTREPSTQVVELLGDLHPGDGGGTAARAHRLLDGILSHGAEADDDAEEDDD